MGRKKVFCYDVRIPENYNFSEVLLNPEFQEPVDFGLKKIEIYNATRDQNRRIITGMFVCTQTRDLPPAHTPGEEDYSAVPLGNGQGLAYPNAFIYCEQTKVLYLEYNRAGATIANLIAFFNQNAIRLNYNDWEIGIAIILSQDAYERASRIITVKEVTVQVATPQKLIQDHVYSHGSFEDIALLGRDLNASRAISVSIKGEYEDGGIRKNKILSIIQTLNRIGQKLPDASGSTKNKLLIVGTVNTEDGAEREEVINLFIDRLIGFFYLEDMPIHPNLQPVQRRSGMNEVYDVLNHQVENIIGLR